MSDFKCGCGSTLFFQLIPQVIDSGDMRVFNAGQMIKPDHASVALLLCVGCGTITIPSVSLQGKNALDRDVKVYRELIDTVNVHNNRVKSTEDVIIRSIFNADISDDINNKVKDLEYKLHQVASDLSTLRDMCADIDPQVINPRLDDVVGEVSVKKVRGSKKSS